MDKPYNTSELAKQVSETLNLNQQKGLELYKELSQLPNGCVKEALDTLSLIVKTASGNKACEIDLAQNYPACYAQIIEKITENKNTNSVGAMTKYAACIKGTCVRDAQYSKFEDAMPLDDDAWKYANDIPLFLKIVEAETPTRAKQIAAAYAGTTEDVIELYTM